MRKSHTRESCVGVSSGRGIRERASVFLGSWGPCPNEGSCMQYGGNVGYIGDIGKTLGNEQFLHFYVLLVIQSVYPRVGGCREDRKCLQFKVAKYVVFWG